MGKMMKTVLSKLRRDETGQAFILVMILLIVGGLIITPLLGFMGTGLIAGQLNEKNMAELYAADAGIEDALWRIKTKAAGLPQAEGEDPMEYSIADVNGKEFVGSNPIIITYIDEITYKIESTATSTDTGSSTTIVSYLNILDFVLFTDNAITSMGDIQIGPGSVVDGKVQYNGELDDMPGNLIPDENENTEVIVGWPTAELLSAFYRSDLQDNYFPFDIFTDGTVIDVKDTDPIGPLYSEGNLTIETTEAGTEATLDGTVYVAGDLDFRQTGKRYDIYLNGKTIYVEGSVDFPSAGQCYLTGPGAIIAVGDINFQPNMEGEEFIFVMSVEGEVYFSPNGDFTGSIAGNTNVDLQPGNTLTWTEPPPDLNYPGADASTNVISAILTWEIDPQ